MDEGTKGRMRELLSEAGQGFCLPAPLLTLIRAVLLVFSVTPFKIDQNRNQNRSIDKVQNLGNERR